MPTAPNGQPPSRGGSTRRLRFDDLGSILARRLASSGPEADALAQGHSGRRFVLVAGAVLLVIWGVLYWNFRDWKTRYRRRASYGATQVVPAIDPMATLVPPGVDPDAWRDAVQETRAMLATVVGSNLLDIEDMDRLRTELMQHAERAQADPAAARDELAAIWNELADRGIPVPGQPISPGREAPTAQDTAAKTAAWAAEARGTMNIYSSVAESRSFAALALKSGNAPNRSRSASASAMNSSIFIASARIWPSSPRGLEPGIDVGLVPLVAPDSGQGMP